MVGRWGYGANKTKAIVQIDILMVLAMRRGSLVLGICVPTFSPKRNIFAKVAGK